MKKISLRGSNSASAAARRSRRATADASMMTSGQTRTSERRRRNKGCGSGRQTRSLHLTSVGAKVSSRPLSCRPRVNLRRTIRVGAWNVRTLRYDHSICQLSDELRRLRVSVAALSEVRRPGSGQISVGGYTYYWSGQDSGLHFSGVAIALADWLIPAVDNISCLSDRVMSLRLRHSLGTLAVFSVYAPTSKGDEDNKNRFYQQLSAAVEQCTARETPLVMGDFNAVVGSRRDGYESVMGPHGHGSRTENGSRLLQFASSHSLKVAGTWFQRSDYHRWTWYSNTGSWRSEIDHILVGSRWRLLRNCRVFRSAQFSTDHRLLVAELHLRIRSTRTPSGNSSYNVELLRDPEVQKKFQRNLADLAADTSSRSRPGDWESLRDLIKTAAQNTIGSAPRKKHHKHLPPEIADLINLRRRARLCGNTVLYRSLRSKVRKVLREAENSRTESICREVSSNLFTINSRLAFKAISALSGLQPKPTTTAVLAADGSVLEGSLAIQRFAEYFEDLLNVQSPPGISDMPKAILAAPDPPINTHPPTLLEVREVLGKFRSGRAAGICQIPAELLKNGGDLLHRELTTVFRKVWTSEEIPSDWKRSIIVPIYKRKGDPKDCGNYRGISLLSVAGKMFARILLDRIRPHLLEHQRPEQSGFSPKKSTVDRILALRVLIERRREFRKPFLGAYVDFRKAFDSVHRGSLWKLLYLRGIPSKIIALIQSLYSDSSSAVRIGGEISEYFAVATGVRQGCVLAPSLFNVCMDWVLGRTVEQGFRGASFGNEVFTDLDFADDAVIFAETLDSLVLFLEALSKESKHLGLQVSWIKTKIQRFIQTVDQACEKVMCCGNSVDVVEVFPYLGSRVTSDGSSLIEIDRRLGVAWGVVGSLKRVWRSRYLSRRTKVEVFKRLVLPSLLYGCESWTLTAKLRARLDSFGTINLRRILGYKWFDFVPNKSVLQMTSMKTISGMVAERQLSMFGHVARLSRGDPVHRIISCSDPSGWKRRPGRPHRTWLRQMDDHCQRVGTDRVSAWVLAKGDPKAYRVLGRDVAKRPHGGAGSSK